MADICYRIGTLDDSYAVFTVMHAALLDFGERSGVMAVTGGRLADVNALWQRRQPLWEHLARTCDQFWITELDGKVTGYARSILRDGVRELTEFFVLPSAQSMGIGRELLDRAFPFHASEQRVIIATDETPALALYLKSGVYARVPEYYFSRLPRRVDVDSGLTIVPTSGNKEDLDCIAVIDRAILGHRRDIDHAWLCEQRQGFIYLRQDHPVGYGYISRDWSGPFALLEAGDFPTVLAHAESQAYELGAESIGFEVPLVNSAAVNYLLRNGYRLDGFLGSVMSDEPFGRFENYLITSPPYFL